MRQLHATPGSLSILSLSSGMFYVCGRLQHTLSIFGWCFYKKRSDDRICSTLDTGLQVCVSPFLIVGLGQ